MAMTGNKDNDTPVPPQVERTAFFGCEPSQPMGRPAENLSGVLCHPAKFTALYGSPTPVELIRCRLLGGLNI